MSDTERRLDDIEKRVTRLERAAEKPAVNYNAALPADNNGRFLTWDELRYGQVPTQIGVKRPQFCECGRDVCRAPDCPSHKPDPLGR
jgi:hypothetical protein